MAKIAVDIDDTLYSFTSLAREVLAHEAACTFDKQMEQAAYAAWPEWRTPPDMLSVEKWIHIVDLCHDDDKIISREPFPGVQDVLSELAQHHELVYVSNRRTERQEATQEWLTVNEFPQADLVCAQHYDKKDYIRDCQYLIDDRPKTLIQFTYSDGWKEDHTEEEGRVGFGLMTEFNRSLTDIPNIYLAPHWSLLRHHFIKAGVIPEVESYV